MKTNQVMIRQMGDFKVEQRTKDGFFNATSLMKQWNDSSKQSKNVNHYLDNSSTKEFIKALIEDDESIRNSENPLNQLLTRKKCVTLSNGTKKAGEYWMHPLLFIDFAMWLNPTFKVKVLKFVQDEMIKFRNMAGDSYPTMCKAIRSIFPDDKEFKDAIQKIACALNIIVYGKHEHLMRNKIGDPCKVRELFELQQQVATWINIGLVKSFEQLKSALTNMYLQKFPNILPM